MYLAKAYKFHTLSNQKPSAKKPRTGAKVCIQTHAVVFRERKKVSKIIIKVQRLSNTTIKEAAQKKITET